MISGDKPKKYSSTVRAFAFTLHFYSPRAYNYVRSVLNDRLPAVSTIRKWISSINGEPGFSKEAFDVLKLRANDANKNGNEILSCLIFDEMAIRKREDYDEHNDKKIGLVTYGTDKNKYAKEALVFLISGINDKFKIPVAYFLIAGLKADEKAALTREVILMIGKTGIKVVGMTFDGLNTNISVCKTLGADFVNNKGYIINPHSDEKIYVYLDACHMLKLARNILASKKSIFDSDKNAIEWRFIEELEKYQRENKFNLANKINKRHIQWDRNKMCVRVASETMSNSTADAIDLLRSNGVPGFENSEPTTKYLRMVNNSFDILNSKHDDALRFKRSISKNTKDEYFAFFDEAIEYFQGLKLTANSKKTIIQTRSKTPFFGFILDLNNFRSFYYDYVESSILYSIPTFRFSQDHLELLFACIRSMFGCNDNPSPRHLESAWRKLLGQHQITASKSANCIENDVELLSVLDVSSRKKPIESNVSIDALVTEGTPVEFEDPFDVDELTALCWAHEGDFNQHSLKSNIISYIAAHLESCILNGRWYKKINCERCLAAFREDAVTDDDFVNIKMKTSKLRAPAISTVRICAATEKFMEKHNFQPGHFNEILSEAIGLLGFHSLFSASDFDNHSNANHKMELIKLIIEMYVKKRFDYLTKTNTLDSFDKLVRNRCRKAVHFRNQ